MQLLIMRYILFYLCFAGSAVASVGTILPSGFSVESELSFNQQRANRQIFDFKNSLIQQGFPYDVFSGYQFKILLRKQINPQAIFIPGSEAAIYDLEVNPNLFYILFDHRTFYSRHFKRLMAHEFFHAYHYLQNPGEDLWLREGLAQLFEYFYLGSFNVPNIRAALKNTNVRVDALQPKVKYDSNVVAAQYGEAVLYFYYLYQNCGGKDLFWNIVAGEGKRGIKNINHALEKIGSKRKQCRSYHSSVVHYKIAKLHNRRQLTKEQQDYFLLSTSIRSTLTVQADLQILNKLQAMKPLDLLIVKHSQVELTKKECPSCRIFWLEQQYPYSVHEKTPSKIADSKRWKIVLIKE